MNTSTNLDREVRNALSRVIDPELRKPVTELDMIGSITASADGAVVVGLTLTLFRSCVRPQHPCPA